MIVWEWLSTSSVPGWVYLVVVLGIALQGLANLRRAHRAEARLADELRDSVVTLHVIGAALEILQRTRDAKLGFEVLRAHVTDNAAKIRARKPEPPP